MDIPNKIQPIASQLLPYNYKRLLAIESLQSSESLISDYGIITDYVPNQHMRLEVDIKYKSPELDDQLGCVETGYSKRIIITANRYSILFTYNNNSSATISTNPTNRHLITLDLENKKCSIDSNVVDLTGSTTSFSQPLGIFSRIDGNNRSSMYYGGGGSIVYGVKIYEKGVLVRNYVPAQEMSTGINGLYETVKNKFLQNYKPNYNFNPHYFLPDGFQQLFSIRCVENDYVDTDIFLTPGKNTRMLLKIRDFSKDYQVMGITEKSTPDAPKVTENCMTQIIWRYNSYPSSVLFTHNNSWQSGISINADFYDTKLGGIGSIYEIDMDTGTYTTYLINKSGEKVSSSKNVTPSMSSGTVSYKLFRHNVSGYYRGSILSAKFWQNGELVRDLIPVIAPDGDVCFFDIVSGKNYPSYNKKLVPEYK